MAHLLTTDDLVDDHVIADEEVDAAVVAFLGPEAAKRFHFHAGYWLNLEEAIESNRSAYATISGGSSTPARKRGIVRTAFLRAYPHKD